MDYDLKIFTENIEPEAINQIYELIRLAPFQNAKIRIMPDVHYGKGCVVGFTSTTNDKIIPNVIGVDIGCGMLTVPLGKKSIDMEALDKFIRNNIPAGSAVHKHFKETSIIKQLRCFDRLGNLDKLYCSMGTLGGGNHFIEIDIDDSGEYYIVIHTGSRNLGQQVATLYQKQATEMCKNAAEEEKNEAHKKLVREGRVADIPDMLKQISEQFYDLTKIPAHQCHLWGEAKDDYLHDVKVCQEFARKNRLSIAESILKHLKISGARHFDTIHNYIDDYGITRKGSISAHKGEQVIIPMNMRDGCLIAVGKGNPDWNCSAPHGAGRLYSRQDVQTLFTVEEFEKEMEGIYTTSVGRATLDESPMAYKPMEEIVSLISPTVDIVKVIKPVYNFKAGK